MFLPLVVTTDNQRTRIRGCSRDSRETMREHRETMREHWSQALRVTEGDRRDKPHGHLFSSYYLTVSLRTKLEMMMIKYLFRKKTAFYTKVVVEEHELTALMSMLRNVQSACIRNILDIVYT